MESKSEVIQFLDSVWRNTNEVSGHSWTRLNEAMYKALHLAIDAGFRFKKDDFIQIDKTFRFGYWGGNSGNNGFAEGFYRSACSEERGKGNRSAAIAFELFKKRPAFIYAGKRLSVGTKFIWYDKIPPLLKGPELLEVMRGNPQQFEVEVSSFAEHGNYINAVWFEKEWREREPGKSPDRRFQITREDLKRVYKALNPPKPKEEEKEGADDAE